MLSLQLQRKSVFLALYSFFTKFFLCFYKLNYLAVPNKLHVVPLEILNKSYCMAT